MWQLVLFVALLCCGSEVSGISCKNENNGDVDWYILYKLPEKTDTVTGTGLRFYYIGSDTVNVPNPKPILQNHPINHQHGVLANTLTPYFDPSLTQRSDVGFIAYNDATKPNQNRGHSKGLVMMDKTSGFWLLHSTPDFPTCRMREDFYPDSGETNAQTFICVTFPYATFKDIGLHIQCIKAPIFKQHIPPGFHESLRDAANIKKCDPNKLPTLSYPLKSEKGQEFAGFVSRISEKEDGDLYVTIAETIKSHVQVQTWGSQVGRSGSYITPNGYHVVNVECISIEGISWKPTKDHSKWCVSASGDWTCIADSNRAVSQFDRPGGALCIKNKGVTDIFKGFIKNESACK